MNKVLAKNLLQMMLGGLLCSQLAFADVAPLSVNGNKILAGGSSRKWRALMVAATM